MANIEEMEGIGAAYAAKLRAAGVTNEDKLLELGGTKKGREDLAESTSISETLILGWVNKADLMRIKGIGSQFSDLLEAAGVDSVAELAQRSPANLAEKLAAVNAEKNLTNRTPSEEDVADWVAQAKDLPKAVTH